MRRILCILALFLFLNSTLLAENQPEDLIGLYIDKVINIVNHAQTLKKEEKANFLKKELRNLAEDIFLFDVMARMTLGFKWRSFSKEQRKEFKELFIKFIEKNYFSKLMEYLDKVEKVSRDDIVIKSQKMLSRAKAEVQTIFKYNDKEIPINYRLVNIKGAWKVYDVYVEGVGLVQNYRKQFQVFLRNRTPEQFLEFLKEKIREKPEDKNEKKD